MEALDGTRVLVTGATSGIGRAMAEALAAAGARVGVASRSRTRAEATARELRGQVMAFGVDVRDEQSVAMFVDEARARLGGIDMLVNNAGIGMRTVNPRFPAYAQPFWEVSPSGFRDVVETKVTGVFLVSRAVVPLMLAAGSGRVVNISMNEATTTNRGFVPYGPSGAAVEALSRIMAADLAEHRLPSTCSCRAAQPRPEWFRKMRPPNSALGCSIRRSWGRPSSGSPPGKPKASTMSASSLERSRTGAPSIRPLFGVVPADVLRPAPSAEADAVPAC